MGREIRVEDVEKYYRNGRQVTKAVDRVSFTVEPGEFMGVMGASGSGKTNGRPGDGRPYLLPGYRHYRAYRG